MRVLVITNLFPNRAEAHRGHWNKRQVWEMSQRHKVRVVAPVAWFPFVARAMRRAIPDKDMVDGLETYYPRYFYTPKILRSLYALWMFLSILPLGLKLWRTFKPNCVFATWAYPDAFASLLLARLIGVPIIVKVHGSDIHQRTRSPLLRQIIKFTLRRSARIICVSHAQRDMLVKMGISPDKCSVVYNGVDADLFQLLDQKLSRERLNLPKEKDMVIFVGNLTPIKGIDFLLNAFSTLCADGELDPLLVIVGKGEMEKNIKAKAARLNIQDRVLMAGYVPHSQLPIWINSADVLCLPSLNEGMPNVVLESLSCGVPVVCSSVSDLPLILANGFYGKVVPPGDVPAVKRALAEVLKSEPRREQLRDKAKTFSWQRSGAMLTEIIEGAVTGLSGSEIRAIR